MLLALLTAAALLAIGAAFWSFSTMDRESREPFRDMSAVLSSLAATKVSIQQIEDVLRSGEELAAMEREHPDPGEGPVVDDSRRVESSFAAATTNLRKLDSIEAVAIVSGKTATSNIHRRLSAAHDTIRSWLEQTRGANAAQPPPGVEATRLTALHELNELHSLIERIERQIIASTELSLTHVRDLRARFSMVLLLSLVVVAQVVLLGMFLVRRWVLRPISDLRTAASRIASGDFAHRIEVRGQAGKDELRLLSREVNHMTGMVKSLQDERVDRERLAALGEMVRRLAHNLRNPLSGIRGLAEVSKTDIEKCSLPVLTESPELAHLRADLLDNQTRIIASIDRFERWLADLLRATRPAQLSLHEIDCPAFLRSTADVYIASGAAKGVEVVLDAERAPAKVIADHVHLEHALGALIANAVDAAMMVPDGPKWVRITARNGAPESERDAVQTGQSLCWTVEVADSGPGVPPDMHERIFAPYFTTKRDGTGIGLATALQVVRAHGGQITLLQTQQADSGAMSSGSRSGAIFRVALPVHPEVAKDQQVARIGQTGAGSGEDPHHRR